MRFIFTDKDQYFKDEFQEAWLSEETGWWTPSGEIYIWTPGQERLKQLGVAVHEGFEWFIICRVIYRWKKNRPELFHVLSDLAHNSANILEFIVSLGTADQYWGSQDWGESGIPGKDQGWGGSKRKDSQKG